MKSWTMAILMACALAWGASESGAATEIWHLTATNITGVANGGSVSNWPASAGPNATQATAGQRPLWYNSDANLPNSRPIVRFVRSSSNTMNADFTSSYGGPLTFFIVAYIRPVSGYLFVITDSITGNNRVCVYQGGTAPLCMWSGSTVLTGPSGFESKWIICEAQFNGASSLMYTNGTQSGSGNVGTTSISASDDLCIGRLYSGSQYLDADIAEIIAYQGTLTSAERNAIGYNLGAFYGIANAYSAPPVAPVAAFSGTPTNGPAPQTVTFTDQSTGAPSSWSWTFGDGSVSTLQNPTHTYATGGTYDVTLTVTNAVGSNTLTRAGYIALTNPPPPVAGFSANITSGCYRLAITFTNQSSGQVNAWLWDFGDGSNSVAQSPTHTYTTSGVYTVSLTAINPGGSNTLTRSSYVAVTAPPAGGKEIEFRADALVGLTNGQFMSSWADVSGNGRDVGQNNAAKKPFYATNRINGLPAVQFRSTYTVSGNCLTNTGYSIAQPYTIFMVARSDGDNGANTVDVLLDGYPGSANRIIASLSWSGGLQANFYTWAGGASPLSFPWTQPFWSNWHVYEMQFAGTNSTVWVDGASKATANAGAWALTGMTLGDHQAYNTGLNGEMAEFVVYSGSLTSADRNSVGSALCSKYGLASTYAAPPVAAFSATPTNGPAPRTVTFTDQSTGVPSGWSWTFGDGGVSTLQNPTHTYATGGTYNVALTVTNAVGSNTLSRTGCIVLTNPPPPVAGFSANVTSGCYRLSVTFTDQSSGQVNSWLWDFGDGSNSVAQSPTHTYTTSGVYTVALTAINPGGSNTMIRSSYIAVTPPPASGKEIEFRADALVGLTNGQFMSNWSDISGNSRDVGQNNAARKPFFATNRINGLPAVQFRSTYSVSGNCLTNTGYSIAQPYTIFMVARSDGDNGANSVDVFLDGYPGSTNRIYVSLNTALSPQANFYTYAGTGYVSFPWPQPFWSNWHVYEMQFAGTNATVWVDGASKATANAGAWALTGMTLGDVQTYGAGLNGEMAEFVVYGGSLTSTDRYNVGSALCSKYGLANSYSPPGVSLAADFSASPTNGPAPQTVAFNDLSTGGPTNWSWTFGDGGVSTLSGPTHTFPTAGVYTVSLAVSGAGGVSTNTKTGYIVITNPPPPVADFSGTPVTGPYPLAVAFTNQATGQVNAWSWNFGDGWVSTATNPTHIYGAAGVYTVTLTVSNPGGSNTVIKTGYITTTNPPTATEVLRLRASDITGVTNGGNVATWTATVGPNATQTNASNRPLWVNSDSNLPNGKPVVRFARDPTLNVDPNGDFMRVGFATNYPQPLTVFLVAQIRPVTNGNAFVYDDDTFVSQDARFAMYQPTDSRRLSMYAGGQELGFTDAAVTNGWHILEASYSGSASTFYMDGVVKAAGAVGVGGLQAVRGLRIGARYSGDYQLNGDIAEMVIYSGVVSDALRNYTGASLMERYGLSTTYRYPGTIFKMR